MAEKVRYSMNYKREVFFHLGNSNEYVNSETNRGHERVERHLQEADGRVGAVQKVDAIVEAVVPAKCK